APRSVAARSWKRAENGRATGQGQASARSFLARLLPPIPAPIRPPDERRKNAGRGTRRLESVSRSRWGIRCTNDPATRRADAGIDAPDADARLPVPPRRPRT